MTRTEVRLFRRADGMADGRAGGVRGGEREEERERERERERRDGPRISGDIHSVSKSICAAIR